MPHLSHNQPFRLGRGGMHMARGGDAQGGGGGMHVHPVHPPWVRPWLFYSFFLIFSDSDAAPTPVTSVKGRLPKRKL
jgi:hypothetical protein